ncbi:MAG: hypothetical protein ACYTAS_06090 [Planctomycetota bacterium]|jgi:hypothetical protein
MMLNGRQKAGVAVLAVGIAALAIDRVFVLPKSAPASEPGAFVDSYTAPAPEGETAPAASRAQTVARRLDAAWSDKNLRLEAPRNLFALPESWDRNSASGNAARPRRTATASFAAAHTLEAIIIDAEGQRALIDDRLVRLGESLDGYELVGVNKESVIFERDGERIEFRLTKGR